MIDDNALNAKQREAVDCLNSNLLIIAGAGTGKTKTIVERIKYILNNSIAELSQVLAVTFTNKAANEMRNRIFANQDYDLQSINQSWIGTFHSIAVRILRNHGALIDIAVDFVIFDSADQLALIKNIIAENNFSLTDKNCEPKFVLQIIQSWKDKFLNPEQAVDAAYFAEKHIIEIYSIYQDRLSKSKALDFGDLLFFVLKLFNKFPEVLSFYQQKFKFITIDEFQDTNFIQYAIIKKLVNDNSNLCCVGDDDQSIYSWRGAEVSNIRNFHKDFPDAKIIKIEQNYRSTDNILNAADSIIAHNTDRIHKKVWTTKKGEKVKVVNLYTSYDEAKFLVEEIKKLKERNKIFNFKQVSILIRSNSQTRILEECFTQLLLPYEIFGGIKFYNRQEVKDIIAYLRLLINPLDDTSFERIINKPKRKFGEQSLKKLKNLAEKYNLSYLETLCIENDIEVMKLSEKLTSFLIFIKKWQSEYKLYSLDALIKKVLEESGYKLFILSENTPSYAEDKLQNIEELINAVQHFEKLEDFLEHLALMNEINDENKSNDSVKIMTFHAAKGLEFDYVFLPGWEEGNFPNFKILKDNDLGLLQEERRLAYVGITRAKIQAIITHVSLRYIQDKKQSVNVSRFINEIKPQYADFLDLTTNAKKKYNQYLNIQKQSKVISPLNTNHLKKTNNLKKPVRHKVFGDGKVLEKKGKILTIVFNSGQVKKIVDEFIEYV